MGLFGKKKKPDFGAVYGNHPVRGMDQAAYDRYKSGYNDLTSTFERRSKGEDIFDYMKYLFEPQKTQVQQDYGLTGDPNDVYSNRTGQLPQTLASLNSRGLLDSGTSGVVEGQLRSNMTNKLADLFGQSKQLQRQDIDNALDALHTLYPENFQIADIPYSLAYDNAMNQYGVDRQRNAAQSAYEGSQGPKTFFGQMAPLFGQVAGTALGSFAGPGGAALVGQLGGQLGGMAGGQSAGWNYKPSSGGFDLSSIMNIFNRNKSSAQSSNNANDFSGSYGGGVNPNPYQSLNSQSIFGASQPKSMNYFRSPSSSYYLN